MIREGQPDLTLRYIAESPKRLAISNFTDGERTMAKRGPNTAPDMPPSHRLRYIRAFP